MIGLSSVFTAHGMLLVKKYQNPAMQHRFAKNSTNAQFLKELKQQRALLNRICKKLNAQSTQKKICPTKELLNHNFRDKHHGSYYSGTELVKTEPIEL